MVVSAAVEHALGAAASFAPAQSLDELHLCLLNPAVASPELMASPFFTAGCQALLDEKIIVLNEQFLLEIEAAMRSFAQSDSLLGAPFLKNDAQMFGLVRRIDADPARYLARLRRQAQRETADADAERHLQHELAMVALFFIGHELGHFLHGHPSGEFATFVDPDVPLESRIEDAVVKLCRHVDEFEPTQWANRVVVAHLTGLAKEDAAASERGLYGLARGLFVAAIYTWYKDLDVFARKMGIDAIADTRQLNTMMMQGRERYIHSASLFGERHRFTWLRAALALEVVMRARTTWFDLAPEARSIWCAHSTEAVANDPTLRGAFWLAESLQRYFLLCVSMDTAVKLATVGCSTGWMLEADRRRGGPQIFIMQFMGIDDAVARVRQMR